MHDNCDMHDQNAIDSYDHSATRQSPTTKFQLDPRSLHMTRIARTYEGKCKRATRTTWHAPMTKRTFANRDTIAGLAMATALMAMDAHGEDAVLRSVFARDGNPNEYLPGGFLGMT